MASRISRLVMLLNRIALVMAEAQREPVIALACWWHVGRTARRKGGGGGVVARGDGASGRALRRCGGSGWRGWCGGGWRNSGNSGRRRDWLVEGGREDDVAVCRWLWLGCQRGKVEEAVGGDGGWMEGRPNGNRFAR